MTTTKQETPIQSKDHLDEHKTASPADTPSPSSRPGPAASPATTTAATTSISNRKSEAPESPLPSKRRHTTSREATPPEEDDNETPRLIINGRTLGGPDHLTHLARSQNCLPISWTQHDRGLGSPCAASSPPPELNWRDYEALPLGAWDDTNEHEYADEEEFWQAFEEVEEKLECYEVRGMEEGLVVYERGGKERGERGYETGCRMG
ncbi:hypothetical protein Slin15195_G121400 [Septoria linicola]|uniref:Uncharacterized protein n=1 Tax=Septoria linicola TaxID=215465 RepID=A0A9Q9B857_9PEZI|nr:hypothetical protein Slin15195_G121400 [Septoria linicola]